MKKLFFILFIWQSVFWVSGQTYKMIIKTFSKQEGNVTSVAVNPDETVIAAGSDDKAMRLWNISTGELVSEFPDHNGAVNFIQFSKNGNYIYEAADKFVRLWEVTGRFIRSYSGHVTFIYSFALNPDETRMVTGSYEDKFKVWDLNTAKILNEVTGHNKSVLAVAMSPDGRLIATGSLDMTIRIWDAVSMQIIDTLHGHGGNIYDLEFTPDNNYLFSASKDKSVKLWDIQTGKQVRTFTGHKEAVLSLCLSPDGKHLLSSSLDKTIILWNITDAKQIYIFNDHTGPVNSVKYFKDGVHFISGGNNKELFLWQINPRIFVDSYFGDKLQEEISASYLFRPKGENEKATEYKERQMKQENMKTMLYEKYYNQYLLVMKHKPIDEHKTDVNIRIEP